ncbi:MAG: VOC family protein [Candidatus Thorarchaeota archaeon]
MVITGIDVVFLHVKDPELMAEWYQEVLGVNIGFKTDDLSWQEFELVSPRPPTRFAIEHVGLSASEVEQQHIMVSFRVEDVARSVEELEAKGITFYGDPKIMNEGPSLFATLRDPEGNWIQLSQRKQS